MNAPRSRPASKRYFMWLLWLALLLPVAQSSAAWHALSHTSLGASADSNKPADGKRALSHPTHCDLCLTASTVSGGALPSTSPALAQSIVRHRAPQTVFADVWATPLAHAYRSRAPPSSLL